MMWLSQILALKDSLLAVAFHVIVAMATAFLSVRTAEERQIFPLSVIVRSNLSRAWIEESVLKNVPFVSPMSFKTMNSHI